jgi:hypothetical protein
LFDNDLAWVSELDCLADQIDQQHTCVKRVAAFICDTTALAFAEIIRAVGFYKPENDHALGNPTASRG